MIEPLIAADHKGRTIFRMSVNPDDIIRRVEFGTSPLLSRIAALNKMNEAGYQTGLLIAPVILMEDWKTMYSALVDTLAAELSDRVKKTSFIEVIFMTYSYVQNAINKEAFKNIPELFDPTRQTGRGKGKYCYREAVRTEGEAFIRAQLGEKLPEMRILYIV
jgi:spore photoproduct lyase